MQLRPTDTRQTSVDSFREKEEFAHECQRQRFSWSIKLYYWHICNRFAEKILVDAQNHRPIDPIGAVTWKGVIGRRVVVRNDWNLAAANNG